MNLNNIRQALSLNHSVTRYNHCHDARLTMQHVRVLFLLRIFNRPVNRLELLTMLCKRSFSMNYTQLDNVFSIMSVTGMVKMEMSRSCKVYYLTAAGHECLAQVETGIRKMRYDKILQQSLKH